MALKGQKCKPRTPEHCRNISLSKKGVPRGPFTKEHRQRISEALKQHKRTKAHATAISRALKGKPGHKVSLETRKKQSLGIAKAIMEGRGGGCHPHGSSGFHMSLKPRRLVRYRSLLERAWFERLDVDPVVKKYKVECVRIPYWFDGVLRYYVPDLKITWASGRRTVMEIKPEAWWNDPRNIAKWRAAKAWCRQRQMSFRIAGVIPY